MKTLRQLTPADFEFYANSPSYYELRSLKLGYRDLARTKAKQIRKQNSLQFI